MDDDRRQKAYAQMIFPLVLLAHLFVALAQAIADDPEPPPPLPAERSFVVFEGSSGEMNIPATGHIVFDYMRPGESFSNWGGGHLWTRVDPHNSSPLSGPVAASMAPLLYWHYDPLAVPGQPEHPIQLNTFAVSEAVGVNSFNTFVQFRSEEVRISLQTYLPNFAQNSNLYAYYDSEDFWVVDARRPNPSTWEIWAPTNEWEHEVPPEKELIARFSIVPGTPFFAESSVGGGTDYLRRIAEQVDPEDGQTLRQNFAATIGTLGLILEELQEMNLSINALLQPPDPGGNNPGVDPGEMGDLPDSMYADAFVEIDDHGFTSPFREPSSLTPPATTIPLEFPADFPALGGSIWYIDLTLMEPVRPMLHVFILGMLTIWSMGRVWKELAP